MQKEEPIIRRAFGSVTINPRSPGVCVVTPPNSPYFQPKRCRIACVDPANPGVSLDLKIGAVTIGGSPQLAMNELQPDERSQGLRPADLDYVNWGVFSTPGLARGLQFVLYNPNDIQAAVFVCLEGFDVDDLNRDFPDDNWQERARERHQDFLDAERAQGKIEIGDRQHLSGQEIELDPLEQRIIKIVPTVSPYFEPKRVRFYGYKSGTSESVPFTVIDAFCGSQILYGTMVEDLFAQQKPVRRDSHESPQQLLKRLGEMVDTLTSYGRSGLEMLENRTSRPALEDARGMLTTHLVGEKGWGDVSWWPTFSTSGLRRELGVVAYNPWPFRIRVSVSIEGDSVVELHPSASATKSLSHTPEFEFLPMNAPNAPADLISLLEECHEGLSKAIVSKMIRRGKYEQIATVLCQENATKKTTPVASLDDIADYCMMCMQYDIEKTDDAGTYRVTLIGAPGKGRFERSMHIVLGEGAVHRSYAEA